MNSERIRKGLLVMTSTGIDFQGVARNLEYNPIGGVDSDAPFPRKVALERFRFPYAIKAVAINAFEKVVDTLRHFCVALNDAAELIPGFVVPDFFHAARLRCVEARFALRRFAIVRPLVFCRSSASAIRRATSSSVCS